MKALKNHFVFVLTFLFFFQNLVAQEGTRILPDKACINCETIDASAVLEVRETTKGILIPRLTSTQRMAIPSPANGLLVFDISTGSFWYYSNVTTSWVELDNDATNELQTISVSGTTLTLSNGGGMVSIADDDNDATNEIQMLSISNNKLTLDNGGNTIDLIEIADTDGDTRIQTEDSADEDIIRFDIGGTEKWVMEGSRLASKNTGNSIFIGEQAGLNDDLSANNNVAVGNFSLTNNTSGNLNSAFGYRALFSNVVGHSNTAIGYESMFSNTAAVNTGVGYQSLYSNTTGRFNTGIGYQSLYLNTTKENNTAIGYWSLYNNTGENNTALGSRALYSNTTGNWNTAVGSHVMDNNSTGTFNTALGYKTMESNTSGANNTAVGVQALSLNTFGHRNSAHGYWSLRNNINGFNNTAMGYFSSFSNTTGSNNTTYGKDADYYNETGSQNTIIGTEAGKGTAAHNKSGNILIGYQAGFDETNSNRLYIENSNSSTPLIYGNFQDDTLRVNGTFDINNAYHFPLTDGSSGQVLSTDGSGVISFIPNDDADANPTNEIQMLSISGNDLTLDNGGNTVDLIEIASVDGKTKIQTEESPSENKIRFDIAGRERWVMDSTRLEPINTGHSVFIGKLAGETDDLTDNYNVAIGFQAMLDNTTGETNIAIGKDALYSSTTGNANIAIGTGALYTSPDQSGLVAIGDSALYHNDAEGNTAIGNNALLESTSGRWNTAVGYESGKGNTAGFANTSLGYQAIHKNNNGDSNTGIGYQALESPAGGNANENTAVGAFAMKNATNGSGNTAVGYSALESNTTSAQNTGIGYKALAANVTGGGNIAIGHQALRNPTTTSKNIAIGINAMSNRGNSGTSNIGMGEASLQSSGNSSENVGVGRSTLQHSTGSFNSAFGSDAMKFNTGTNNIGIGRRALRGANTVIPTTGNQNVVIGNLSMDANTSGTDNSVVGYLSMTDNTTGNKNSMLGSIAFENNTSGKENVGIGYQTATSNLSGDSIICIGAYANVNSSTFTNAIAIGHSATVSASRKIRIGNSNINTIEGQVDWSFPSDGRFKYDVEENVPGLEFISKLRPVTYHFDVEKFDELIRPDGVERSSSKNNNVLHSGFIAQEVEAAANEIEYDFHGVSKPTNPKDNYGLRYAEFVVPLVKAVQEINAKEEAVEEKMEALADENAILKNQLEEVEENYNNVITKMDRMEKMIAQLQGCCVEKEASQNSNLNIQLGNTQNTEIAYLEQNAPNPFYDETIIQYFLPEKVDSATMRFTDWQGRNLKTIPLQNSGHGTISISAKELAAGTYAYTLIMDGKIVDTKKMVLTK